MHDAEVSADERLGKRLPGNFHENKKIFCKVKLLKKRMSGKEESKSRWCNLN